MTHAVDKDTCKEYQYTACQHVGRQLPFLMTGNDIPDLSPHNTGDEGMLVQQVH